MPMQGGCTRAMPSFIGVNGYSRRGYLCTIPLLTRSRVKHSGKILEDNAEAFSACANHRFSHAIQRPLNSTKLGHDDPHASTCGVYHSIHENPSHLITIVYISHAASLTRWKQHNSLGTLFKRTRQVHYNGIDISSTYMKHQSSYGTLCIEIGKIYNDGDHDDADTSSTCMKHCSSSGTLFKQAGEIYNDDASSACMKHCFSPVNPSLDASNELEEPEPAISYITKAVSSLVSSENAWCVETEEKLERLIRHVTPTIVMEVVKGIRDPSMALHFLSWSSSKDGYEPTNEVFTHIIGRLARKRNFNDAWRLLEEMKNHHLKPDYAFSIFIHRLKRARKTHGLIKAMCGMGFLEVTPTVSLYTCALEFLLKQNNGEDFKYLYNRMLQDGLVPDQKLFEILIKGCSKTGKCGEAVSFFESMKNEGFVPHVSVYITTICHLSECGNVDCGHWFYKEMIASGCLPSVFGIHEVACALYGDEIKKRIEEFENVVQMMPSLSRIHSFNNLIRFLLDIGKPDEATVVFNRLKSGTPITTEGAKQTPTWNVDSYRFYIFGMYKLGHVVNAMETYVELLRRGPKPTNDISSFLLLNLSREKLIVEALDVCKRIIKCRDPIDIAAQKAFFTLLRIKKHLDVACKLFMTMRKKRCIDEDSDFASLVGFNEDKDAALAS